MLTQPGFPLPALQVPSCISKSHDGADIIFKLSCKYIHEAQEKQKNTNTCEVMMTIALLMSTFCQRYPNSFIGSGQSHAVSAKLIISQQG